MNHPDRQVLHVGCGHRESRALMPPAFRRAPWREIRLDIDTAVEPDIVGSMLDMGAVPPESMDAIYSAHNIEHVHAHEVPLVLAEFRRVLKPDGFVVVTCPDLQAIARLIAEDRLTQPAYQSPAGPVTPLDMLYGHGPALARGHHYMAHKCGFTLNTLIQAFQSAGFAGIAGKRRSASLDLWAVASKCTLTESEAMDKVAEFLPR